MKKLKQFSQKLGLSAGSILMTASTAFGALDVNSQETGGFLNRLAGGSDSVIKPFMVWAADNIPLIFLMVVATGIFVFAGLSVYEKRKGHSQQASEHRQNAWDVFKIGVGAEVLYYGFVSISKIFGIGA